LERQLTASLEQAKEWERKAILAVQEKRDDLAREALLKKQELEEVILQQKNLLNAQHEAVERLKYSLLDLQKKLEEAQRKKNISSHGLNGLKLQNGCRKPWGLSVIPPLLKPLNG
jgi:phage shock protein A